MRLRGRVVLFFDELPATHAQRARSPNHREVFVVVDERGVALAAIEPPTVEVADESVTATVEAGWSTVDVAAPTATALVVPGGVVVLIDLGEGEMSTTSEFYIKKDDRLPSLLVTATQDDGSALDLTTATGVVFRMRRDTESTFAFSRAGVIVTAASGIVRYDWQASDTVTPGTYYGEFVITFAGGKQQTVPTRSSIAVHVVQATVARID